MLTATFGEVRCYDSRATLISHLNGDCVSPNIDYNLNMLITFSQRHERLARQKRHHIAV